MDEEKLYTPREANELLPHVAPTLVELRGKFADAVRIRAEIATSASTNGRHHGREDWSATLARVAELLERLQRWGLILRDIETGLVDFPARVEGTEAYLCWRLGEETVSHWHPRDEGFGGRRPL